MPKSSPSRSRSGRRSGRKSTRRSRSGGRTKAVARSRSSGRGRRNVQRSQGRRYRATSPAPFAKLSLERVVNDPPQESGDLWQVTSTTQMSDTDRDLQEEFVRNIQEQFDTFKQHELSEPRLIITDIDRENQYDAKDVKVIKVDWRFFDGGEDEYNDEYVVEVVEDGGYRNYVGEHDLALSLGIEKEGRYKLRTSNITAWPSPGFTSYAVGSTSAAPFVSHVSHLSELWLTVGKTRKPALGVGIKGRAELRRLKAEFRRVLQRYESFPIKELKDAAREQVSVDAAREHMSRLRRDLDKLRGEIDRWEHTIDSAVDEDTDIHKELWGRFLRSPKKYGGLGILRNLMNPDGVTKVPLNILDNPTQLYLEKFYAPGAPGASAAQEHFESMQSMLTQIQTASQSTSPATLASAGGT